MKRGKRGENEEEEEGDHVCILCINGAHAYINTKPRKTKTKQKLSI